MLLQSTGADGRPVTFSLWTFQKLPPTRDRSVVNHETKISHPYARPRTERRPERVIRSLCSSHSSLLFFCCRFITNSFFVLYLKIGQHYTSSSNFLTVNGSSDLPRAIVRTQRSRTQMEIRPWPQPSSQFCSRPATYTYRHDRRMSALLDRWSTQDLITSRITCHHRTRLQLPLSFFFNIQRTRRYGIHYRKYILGSTASCNPTEEGGFPKIQISKNGLQKIQT